MHDQQPQQSRQPLCALRHSFTMTLLLHGHKLRAHKKRNDCMGYPGPPGIVEKGEQSYIYSI